MMIKSFITLLSFILSSTCLGDQPYFYITESSSQCFYENTPLNLPITVIYKSHDNPGVDCIIKINNSASKTMIQKKVTKEDPEGKITYLTKESGQHSVCIECPSSKWFSHESLKWTLSVDLGDTEIDLDSIAKGQNLAASDRMINLLVKKLTFMNKEIAYNENEQKTLKGFTQALSSKIIYLSVMQMILFFFATFLAIINTQRFLKNEKFVAS